MQIKKISLAFSLFFVLTPFLSAHHAMEFIEMESYQTAFKGEFVFHLHYDYMVDDSDNPRLDHWEYTPGLSYGITARLMLDVHTHFAKFGADHVIQGERDLFEPNGPSPFMEAIALSLQYRITEDLPVNMALVGSYEQPFDRSKRLLNGQDVFSVMLVLSRDFAAHSSLCVNLSAEREGDEDIQHWALGFKTPISSDPHGIAAGIEILGEINGPESILAGVYLPLGAENMILKTGLEFETGGESLRANLSFLYRF